MLQIVYDTLIRFEAMSVADKRTDGRTDRRAECRGKMDNTAVA